VHVHLEKSWGADKLHAPTLSYWCFIPGMAFRMLKALNLRRCMRAVAAHACACAPRV